MFDLSNGNRPVCYVLKNEICSFPVEVLWLHLQFESSKLCSIWKTSILLFSHPLIIKILRFFPNLKDSQSLLQITSDGQMTCKAPSQGSNTLFNQWQPPPLTDRYHYHFANESFQSCDHRGTTKQQCKEEVVVFRSCDKWDGSSELWCRWLAAGEDLDLCHVTLWCHGSWGCSSLHGVKFHQVLKFELTISREQRVDRHSIQQEVYEV